MGSRKRGAQEVSPAAEARPSLSDAPATCVPAAASGEGTRTLRSQTKDTAPRRRQQPVRFGRSLLCGVHAHAAGVHAPDAGAGADTPDTAHDKGSATSGPNPLQTLPTKTNLYHTRMPCCRWSTGRGGCRMPNTSALPSAPASQRPRMPAPSAPTLSALRPG